jgi:probable phosphoglycerate mutase
VLKPNKCTRFGLIRHAQTVWNREKKIQGHSDSPLTAAGKRQAQNWGRILAPFGWDRILVSDVGRAVVTAGCVNELLNLPVELDTRIREQDWGRWVGMTVSQIQSREARELDRQMHAGWDFCPPGGESRLALLKRCRRALQDAARRYPGETILVVCHEGVVKALVYNILGREYLPHEPAVLKSYQLHWLANGKDGLQIEQINALKLFID